MKKYIVYLLGLFITLSVTSCYTSGEYRHRELPPGKAKKVYGSKSAKHHAPGKKKKKYKKVKKAKGYHKYDIYYSPSLRK